MGAKPEPKIYVACLAAYNNGYLHGRWIDAAQDVEVINAEIRNMLAASPIPNAEEWAIHDYDDFAGMSFTEYASVETVHEAALFIEEHGKLGALVAEHLGGTLEEAANALENQYAGEYKSLADFAEELTEQGTEIPSSLKYYIDYERMARDMAISDVFTVELGFEEIHVFWSH